MNPLGPPFQAALFKLLTEIHNGLFPMVSSYQLYVLSREGPVFNHMSLIRETFQE